MRKFLAVLFIAVFCLVGSQAFAWNLETGPFNEIPEALKDVKLYGTYGQNFADGAESQSAGATSFFTSMFHLENDGKRIANVLTFGGSLNSNVAGKGNTGDVQGEVMGGVTILDTIALGLRFNPEKFNGKFKESAGWFFGLRYEF